MTRLAKPEKKAGKGNERYEIYANRRIKANQCRPLNLRHTTRPPAAPLATPWATFDETRIGYDQ
jgi:hypothetical protein